MNPWALIQYAHTMSGAVITAAFVMAGVGAQLGRVVERQRVQAQLAEVAWLEQRRLGQDLHDTIGQELTGIAMVAKSLETRMTTQKASDTGLATQIVSNVQEALSQVRGFAAAVHVMPNAFGSFAHLLT